MPTQNNTPSIELTPGRSPRKILKSKPPTLTFTSRTNSIFSHTDNTRPARHIELDNLHLNDQNRSQSFYKSKNLIRNSTVTFDNAEYFVDKKQDSVRTGRSTIFSRLSQRKRWGSGNSRKNSKKVEKSENRNEGRSRSRSRSRSKENDQNFNLSKARTLRSSKKLFSKMASTWTLNKSKNQSEDEGNENLSKFAVKNCQNCVSRNDFLINMSKAVENELCNSFILNRAINGSLLYGAVLVIQKLNF